MNRKLSLCFFALFQFAVHLFLGDELLAQQENDVSFEKIQKELLSNDFPKKGNLFLHLDGDVYAPGDDIWLSAFTLEAPIANANHTLHVLLVDELNHNPVKSERYLLQNGLATGRFLLPDTLKTGNYSIVAYTDSFLTGIDQPFRSRICVLGEPPKYQINFFGDQVGDSLLLKGKVVQAVHNKQPVLTIDFDVYVNGLKYKTVYQRSDSMGLFSFSLPTNILTQNIEVSGAVVEREKRINFKYPLSFSSGLYIINIYPQGNVLETQQLAKVAFQLKNTMRKGVSENCILLEDGHPVSAAATDTYGFGQFSFIPKAGKHYQIKMDNTEVIPIQEFPKPGNKGWFLRMNTIVSDTLRMEIYVPTLHTECRVVVENGREMLYDARIRLPNGSGRLSLPVKNWNSGLTRIRVFNIDNKQVLINNVFCINGSQTSLQLTTDSPMYHRSSKVKVKLKISDINGLPLSGVFSLSVSSNRVFGSSENTIGRFVLYQRALSEEQRVTQGILPSSSYLLKADKIESMMFMLDNFEYPAVIEPYFKSDARNRSRDGYVLYEEKPLKKPIALLLLGDSKSVITTDAKGNFSFPDSTLVGKAGTKFMLSVIGKSPKGYRLVTENKFKQIEGRLASSHFISEDFQPDELPIELKNAFRFSSANLLNEVTIKGETGKIPKFAAKIDSTGRCYDYVCYLGFLNCRSHGRGTPGQTEAIDGRKYLIDGLTGTEEVLYHCQFSGMPPYIKTIKTISYSEYLPIRNGSNLEQQDQRKRVLFFQPGLQINQKGEAEVDFFTNDKTGEFTIDLQGISGKTVFSKQLKISVRD